MSKALKNKAKLNDFVILQDFGGDPTGVADSSAALQAALNTGKHVNLGGKENSWKFTSQSTYTGTVVLYGTGAKVYTNINFLRVTNGSNSIVKGFTVLPLTTPYTLKRNSSTWTAVVGDVVQSLEGYIPSPLDTDIWASLSSAIKTHNSAIVPSIIFDVSSASGGTNVSVSDLKGYQLTIIIQGYTNSGVSNCDLGVGSLSYGGILLFNGVGRAYNSAILGYILPRGVGNYVTNCRVRYATLCGITLFGQDSYDVTGNTVSFCGESGIKTYQYDTVPGPSETTACISTDGRINGNTVTDNYYDGIDAQVTYGLPWSYVYCGTTVSNNKMRRNRQTGSNCNGSNVVYSGNIVGDNGTHGLKVIGTANVVAANHARNNCTTGTTLEPQVFDLLIQGDDVVSCGNNVSNPSAPSTYNYLHSGISGANPTSGREGLDYGNYCDQGVSRITLSPTIPSSKSKWTVGGSVKTFGHLAVSTVVTVTGTSYTVGEMDSALSFFTSGTCTVTLPSASAFPGRKLSLRNTNTFAINSASANVNPLTGGALSSSILAATAGKWVELQSDGTNWIVMSGN